MYYWWVLETLFTKNKWLPRCKNLWTCFYCAYFVFLCFTSPVNFTGSYTEDGSFNLPLGYRYLIRMNFNISQHKSYYNCTIGVFRTNFEFSKKITSSSLRSRRNLKITELFCYFSVLWEGCARENSEPFIQFYLHVLCWKRFQMHSKLTSLYVNCLKCGYGR